LFTPDFILAAAELAGTDDTRVFPEGFGQGKDIQKGPTRRDWLTSIVHGTTVDHEVKPVDLLDVLSVLNPDPKR
jgi:hypothetical protein